MSKKSGNDRKKPTLFDRILSFGTGLKSRSKRKSKPYRGRTNMHLEGLEKREMFSVNSLWFTPVAGDLVELNPGLKGNMLVVATDNASTKVTVSNFGSNIRITDVGANRHWDYAAGKVGAVEFQGGNGNDQFTNGVTTLPVRAFGGKGDDILFGKNAGDILSGGAGNDYLYGVHGTDKIWGGDGNDRILGGSDADQLYGGAGNDELHGNSGNDDLYGESGNDNLFGESGNDGLFGGIGGDKDTLNGGAGADRFLQVPVENFLGTVTKYKYTSSWNKFWGIKTPYLEVVWDKDKIADRAAEDAVVNFHDTTKTTAYSAGSWTNNEIRQVDEALGELHRMVGSTKLLKTTSKGEVTMLRTGTFSNGAGGMNYGGGKLAIPTSAFTSTNLRDTIFHEIGHNFHVQQQTTIWNAFLKISGWTKSYTKGLFAGTNFSGTFGNNNGWFRSTNAANDFAEGYGGTNPMEDWATVWEMYFRNGRSTKSTNARLAQKLSLVDQLVRTV